MEKWLTSSGFENYVPLLCQIHYIDGAVLLTIQESDLRQPPISMNVFGDIKKLYACIQKLRDETLGTRVCCKETADSLFPCRHGILLRNDNISRQTLSNESMYNDEDMDEDNDAYIIKNRSGSSTCLDPELFKTALSFIYTFLVFLITSFVMTVVHDRVPDTVKYPPLPDLFLDNIPYIPGAFEVTETVGVFMFVVWSVILFFHKHRFILMRRMFSMLGTIFLLRCVTMLITSLSVPGVHLQCNQKFGSWYAKFARTYEIWSGFGMSIQGVKSCGDYMFSGHTSCITLLNFFITEYTPHYLYFIHTITWVANLFGIFFILAAHEHYSIDVFIAFYITSRLFLYYHALANNRSMLARDTHRRKIWFPLFSYFESKCDGNVPNEYEWPFAYPKWLVTYFETNFKMD